MANYSVNQVRQFYVAKALGESSHAPSLSNGNDLGVASFGTGNEKTMYFELLGADGVLRSDFIQVKNLDRVEPIKASKLATPMRKISLAIADAAKSSTNTIAGQDYVLGINFKNFFSSGDDSQYYKDAAVHSTGQSVSQFYKDMVIALNKAFAREDGATATSNPYLRFAIYGTTAAGELEEGDAGFSTDTATKIIIEEKEQDWALGTKKERRIMFDVFPKTVYNSTDDVIWAAYNATTKGYYTTETSTTIVKDGKTLANLEWFCLGERGDQYRMMGYPNYIPPVPADYRIDPTKEYSVIELHYAFTDTGVSSYRTEKEITIAVPNGAAGHVYDVINAIIDEIEYHTGLTIAGLSD